MFNQDSTRPDDSSAPRMGPEYLGQVWRRRKWPGLLVAAAAAAATAGVVLSLPNLYRATATVLVDRPDVSEAFVRASVTGELDTRIRTIHERLTSRERLSSLITRFNLYPGLRPTASVDAAVAQMRRDVKLELKGVDQPNGKIETIAFGLTYSGRDPKLVAEVANTLVDSYIAENAHSRERQADGTADVLGQQLADAGKELDKQERQTTDFTGRYGDELAPQLPANLSAVDRLTSELGGNAEAQRRAIERRDRIETAMADEATTKIESPDSPPAQLAKLKVELSNLQRVYKDEYPEVGRLKTEIASLERQIASTPVVTRGPNPTIIEIDNELKALRVQEAALRRTQTTYNEHIQATPARQRELEDLTRGQAAARERYQALLKSYTDARLAASLEDGQRMEQFRILDRAEPPVRPAAPDRLLLSLVGLLAAMGLGLLTMFLAEKLDTTFHSADELSAFVDVPVLATIRRIPTRAGARSRRWREVAAAFVALIAIGLIGAGAFYLAAGNEQLVSMTARGGQ